MSEYKDFLASNNLKAIEAALTLSEIKLDNLSDRSIATIPLTATTAI